MIVFFGLGNDLFHTRHVYSTEVGSASNSIATGDLNEDGRIDIVSANQNIDSIGVFLAFEYIITSTDYVIKIPDISPVPYFVATTGFNDDHWVDI